MLAPGTLLQNRYRIVNELGRGGMGAVYEALDVRLKRRVALKEALATTPELRKAFEREAQLLANLSHPSLPKVIDHFSVGGGQFLVMEFVPGADLAQVSSRRGGPFPVSQVVAWAQDLLETLEYLHSHTPPVLHRDIKPSNLKVSESGRLILLDFGLAKGSPGSMSRAGVTGSLLGFSPQYAPLEQIQGERTSPRSDLYAAAATLYHLLTGVSPADAITRASAVFADAPDPLTPVEQLNREVPAGLGKVFSLSLSLKPGDRPASAKEMRNMLRQQAAPNARSVGARDVESTAEDEEEQTVVAGKWRDVGGERGAPATTTQGLSQAGGGKRRLLLTGSLAAGLCVVLYALYLNNRTSETTQAVTEAKTIAATPSIPSPFREAMGSVVSVEMKDADGRKTVEADGFFVREDAIATDLSALEGSTQGSAVLAGGASYKIAGVAGVDRARRLAILKVEGGAGAPLTLSKAVPITEGMKVSILAASPAVVESYWEGTVRGLRKKESLIEISAPGAANRSGAPVLDAEGRVVAVMTKGSDGDIKQAAPASLLLDLMKSKQSLTSLAVAGAKDILYDFRKYAVASEETPATGFAKVSAEEARKVLGDMFGSYLTDQSRCPESFDFDTSSTEYLKQARQNGLVVPRVTSRAEGAFTAPGVKQTGYLIFVGECNAPHAVNWGTKRLLIYEGERVVGNVDVGDHGEIIGAYDLNSDGVNELLVAGGYMQMGQASTWASLVEFKGGKMKTLTKFDGVEDDCGAGGPKARVQAAVIYYTRPPAGRIPDFRVDSFRAACTSDLDAPAVSAFSYVASSKKSS